MSGGVDSSVTACLLKEQGYDVIGIHLRFWVDPEVPAYEDGTKFPQNKCCTLEGLTRTRQVAAKLGIPFYVLNFEDSFKEKVVDFFVDGYAQGITPNPCIECNRTIKFGLFLQKMKELGADYIATGHYARIQEKKQNGRIKYELLKAKDTAKDQSYFLYTLTQEKLKHILFPIGDFTKPQVREMANKYGIPEMNQQKESQNLCFFPESKHGPFLQRYMKKHAFTHGPIITVSGQKIGEHNGLPNYTIGQRKGLAVGGIKGNQDGTPWYVVRIDQANNALIVGQDLDLFSEKLTAHTLNFIDDEFTGIAGQDFEKSGKFEVAAKIRSRFPEQPAVCAFIDGKAANANVRGSKNILEVKFNRPQRAITPGQSVVFYDGEKVLGGGIIGVLNRQI